MEPRILLVGRQQSTLDVLVEELKRYGREIVATNQPELIQLWLREDLIDFVVVGGGLDDSRRIEIEPLVKSTSPETTVHLLPRMPGASPASVIPFVNELAVLFKVHAAAVHP